MADTAADVPGKFDLILDGHGYILSNTLDQNLPFRTQRARYGYTPTFVTRQNVSGNYGDNQQDFFLTASQKDWSLGEDNKFFRSNDDVKSRQYWTGTAVDVSVPGQATIARTASASATARTGTGSYPAGDLCFTSSSTNLYDVNNAAVITDRGAHGAGGAITAYACDGDFLFISGNGCTSVRKYSLSAHTFAAWCATPMDDLIFLNNTLYGVAGGVLYTIDSVGTATATFTWKDGTGATIPGAMRLEAFGGKVMILRTSGSTNGAELWQYDGTGVSKLAEYPPNFVANDFCVQSGIIFIAGLEGRNATEGNRVAIWYYANGTIGRAYYSQSTTTGGFKSAITPWGNGLLFADLSALKFYDLSIGGVSTVGLYNIAVNVSMSTAGSFILLATGASYSVYPVNYNSAAQIFSSLIDFESTLTKLFRGVIVDYVPGGGGNGGSVDIWYAVDNTTSYTLLQTGATTGTEYQFPSNTTGRAVSIQVKLNIGTASTPPTLKRVYVRAAPTLTRFRTGEYVLDLTGRNGKNPVQLRNGNSHTLDGKDMLANLVTSATAGTPISITDRLGTFNGIVLLDQMDVIEWRPEEFLVHIFVREI